MNRRPPNANFVPRYTTAVLVSTPCSNQNSLLRFTPIAGSAALRDVAIRPKARIEDHVGGSAPQESSESSLQGTSHCGLATQDSKVATLSAATMTLYLDY